MKRPSLRWGALALALSLGTAAIGAPAAALAHGPGGKVTAVSATSITVQTAKGTSVTSALTSSTVVLKTVAGSTADLKAGAFAGVTLSAAGSTTVTAVYVATKTAASHGAVRAHIARAGHGRQSSGTTTTTGGRTRGNAGTHPNPGAHPNPGTHAGGQIVSFANSQLTLTSRRGQSITYTLAGNATITKTTTGSLSDIKVGQTVRVHTAKGSTTATTVDIQ